ncbi:MAG TPA: protein TolR [Arenimonas sp.]|nr:protein TolR [Arenimonas sp.]
MSTSFSRRHKRKKLKSEINVVPYIDVMLVLLIIFMVTAPLLNLGVDVDLPESRAKAIDAKNKDPVIVSVDADGGYWLQLQGARNEAIAPEALQAKMRAFSSANPNVPVFVAAPGQANYQRVMDAMVLLQQSGVPRVGLMSQPPANGR